MMSQFRRNLKRVRQKTAAPPPSPAAGNTPAAKRAARRHMSDAQFMDNERLFTAAKYAGTFINIIFVVAALTTAAFGLIAAFSSYAESFGEISTGSQFAVLVQCVAAALLITLLLDGSRAGWSFARVAGGTVGWQQAIATMMVIANFAGSVYASIDALPILLSWLGLPLETNMPALSASLSILLQLSLAANVIAGFIYWQLSPANLRLTNLARIDSQQQQMYLTKTRKALRQSAAQQSQQIDDFIGAIAAQYTLDGVKEYLSGLGFDEELLNSPTALPAPSPVTSFFIYATGDDGEVMYVSNSLPDARVKATGLAASGHQTVYVTDVNGKRVWPKTGPLNEPKPDISTNGSHPN